MQDILILVLFLLFSIIPIVFLFETFVRPFQMKRLAKEFGLNYKYLGHVAIPGKGISSKYLRSNSLLKFNILEGFIGNKNVTIFDSSVFWGKTHFIPPSPDRRKIGLSRFTIAIVDNKPVTLQGKISGYYPISRLRDYIKHQ